MLRVHCRSLFSSSGINISGTSTSVLRPTATARMRSLWVQPLSHARSMLSSSLQRDDDQPLPPHQHACSPYQQQTRMMAEYRRPPRRAAPTRVREEEREAEPARQAGEVQRSDRTGELPDRIHERSQAASRGNAHKSQSCVPEFLKMGAFLLQATDGSTGMTSLQDAGCRNFMINICERADSQRAPSLCNF